MSKKKVNSGNTMTLKDFHGGSIPSHLSLPSAPRLTVPTSDGSGSSWANPMARSENRSRPHTSTSHYDHKTPFLTHTPSVGNNFDEDERKPLHGLSAPRRTISDDTIWASPSPVEVKPEYGLRGVHVHPNLWALKKQVAGSVMPEPEPHQSAWSVPNAVSKLAHASALDKVCSGMWQSKTETVHYQKDVTVGEKDYYDVVLARHAERGLGVDNKMQGGRSELVDYERSGVQLGRNYDKLGGSELQQPMPSELTEQPKLKLVPRTKALENSEPSVSDYVQVHGHANFVKPVSVGTESGKEAGHRPKLNLKPRSQPLEQLEGNTERDRNALFGGARPRELVLKERGIDDVAINSFDVVEHSNRIEHSIVRAEKLPDHSTQTRYGEKIEDALLDQRTGKKHERKEQRVDAERVNAQRRNWGGDNRRNMQEADRQQVSERQPSPETWRKPAEQPKSSPDAVSMREGRAASAVELAQAFSRSVSDPKVNDRFSGQRGLNNGRTQMPFSRLVGPTPRPQINGY